MSWCILVHSELFFKKKSQARERGVFCCCVLIYLLPYVALTWHEGCMQFDMCKNAALLLISGLIGPASYI